MTVHFTLTPKRPYSLGLTAERYARFPEAVDRFDGGVYRRLLPIGRGVLCAIGQTGPPSRARLAIRLDGRLADSEPARAAALRIAAVALGARCPVAAFYRAHGDDPVLGGPIRAFRGLRVAGLPSLWEALVTAVLAQQVNLMFAYDIRRELALRYGSRARFFRRNLGRIPGARRARVRIAAEAAALSPFALEGGRPPRPRPRIRRRKSFGRRPQPS